MKNKHHKRKPMEELDPFIHNVNEHERSEVVDYWAILSEEEKERIRRELELYKPKK